MINTRGGTPRNVWLGVPPLPVLDQNMPFPSTQFQTSALKMSPFSSQNGKKSIPFFGQASMRQIYHMTIMREKREKLEEDCEL